MKYFFLFFVIATLASCSVTTKITKFTNKTLLTDSAITNTHIGICLYDVNAQHYIYNYNSQKYFVPASNTKILTCYAAMQYLSDSIIGLKYYQNDTALFIQGTGDPSFLLDEFKLQNVNSFIQSVKKPIYLTTTNWKDEPWGSGWNWTDFGENYCQERSVLPMYYNSVKFSHQFVQNNLLSNGLKTTPTYFNDLWNNTSINLNNKSIYAKMQKNINSNSFTLVPSLNNFQSTLIPYTTNDTTSIGLLKSVYNKPFYITNKQTQPTANYTNIYTQPTDSLLKPMMHRSDNFFAEQALLMVSNEKLGYMNDEAIINYIKKNDFVGMPQMPRWVDGSGLSRYNMFTPQSLVWVLNKMKTQFGLERLKEILPTGGEGTLSSLYKNISGKIFAKTGTLSNHAALSGFLITEKGKLYIFSILTSGYQGSATPVRKAVEKYLQHIQKNN